MIESSADFVDRLLIATSNIVREWQLQERYGEDPGERYSVIAELLPLGDYLSRQSADPALAETHRDLEQEYLLSIGRFLSSELDKKVEKATYVRVYEKHLELTRRCIELELRITAWKLLCRNTPGTAGLALKMDVGLERLAQLLQRFPSFWNQFLDSRWGVYCGTLRPPRITQKAELVK